MYKFLLAVAVVGLTACGTKKEEPAKTDSAVTAPAADSAAKTVDTLKSVEVKADAK